MQLSQKNKTFSDSFLHFAKWDSILNNVKKKMILIADVFLNLWTPKIMVR